MCLLVSSFLLEVVDGLRTNHRHSTALFVGKADAGDSAAHAISASTPILLLNFGYFGDQCKYHVAPVPHHVLPSQSSSLFFVQGPSRRVRGIAAVVSIACCCWAKELGRNIASGDMKG